MTIANARQSAPSPYADGLSGRDARAPAVGFRLTAPGSHHLCGLLFLLLLAAVAVPAGAQVVMDGTLGRAGALSGPAFQVTPDLGRQVGGNLFHSFSKLNLVAGESATFSGPASVQNVLARVTGGASSIDGTLRSTIAGANLYLLNPGGVMFGPNATVDVSGSFVVSTADYVRLADGGRFDARVPANSLLTAAPVDKFGFMSMAPAKITVDGSQLVLGTGQAITLVGGDIEIKNGALVQAPQGTVNLTSVGAVAAEVTATPELPDLVAEGNITISSGASVDVSGEGGGLITIRSGNLTVDNATMTADTTGGMNVRGIDVQLGGLLQVLNGALISSDTSGSGRAGDVTVTAGSLTIDSQESPARTGIVSDSLSSGGGGNAGRIGVTVKGGANILNFGTISSYTYGAGRGGDIEVSTSSLTINGNGTDSSLGISTASRNESLFGAGDGGSIVVRVSDHLRVANSGRISSTTYGLGKGGGVTVEAGSLTIDGRGTLAFEEGFTGIGSGNLGKELGGGDAGAIRVEVQGELQILSRGRISSSSSISGNAGHISVSAKSLTIDGLGDAIVTPGIFSEGGSAFTGDGGINLDGSATGNGGTIDVLVRTAAKLLFNGEISTTTFGSGRAGNITIRANSLLIDGQDNRDFFLAGIASQSLFGASGNAGNITVLVPGEMRIINSGGIATDSATSGNAGSILVRAGALYLDRQVGHDEVGIASRTRFNGDGGTVTVEVANNLTLLRGAGISADSYGPGRGGNVIVTAGLLTIDSLGSTERTGIVSDSLSVEGGGNAGTVTVNVDGPLRLLKAGRISSDTLGAGNAGQVTVRAGTLTIDGGAARYRGGISSSSAIMSATGNGGRVNVEVTDRLQIFNGGVISTETFGSGHGGNVSVRAHELILDRSAEITAQSSGSGSAGQVQVQTTGSIFLRDDSSVSSKSEFSSAGGVIVQAGTRLELYNSRITTEATAGNGGELRLTATDRIHLDHSQIISQAGGSGGNIFIDPVTVSLNQSTISANAVSGNGGNIRINTDYLIRSQDSQITASSEFGVNGQISVLGPSVDLSGSLITLSSGLLGAEARLPERCAVRLPGNLSSFISVGRGGVPPEPGEPKPLFFLLDELSDKEDKRP